MPKTKPEKKRSRSRGRHRGVQSRANADLGAHIRSRGLQTIPQYQRWCRDHGFTTVLNKGWQERRCERDALRRDAETAATQQNVLDHARALGLDSIDAYQAWCRQRDFGGALRKSEPQRRKEIDRHREDTSRAALSRGRRLTRRPRDTIVAIFEGELAVSDLRTDSLRTVAEHARRLQTTPRVHTALRDLLLVAERAKADLFDVDAPAVSRFAPGPGNTFVGGMAALATRQGHWLQPPDTWRKQGHGPRRQFASLARHLLARYELPVLFDTAFFAGVDGVDADRQIGWFEHVGGGNLRTAPGLPVTLTKRMAHEVLNAPGHYTISEALRYGQIVGQEGPSALVETVIATRLGESFEHEDFWSTYLHWLTRHPMLDSEWVGPIADYLNERKFVPRDDGAGEPPEPNLSMKSPASTSCCGKWKSGTHA